MSIRSRRFAKQLNSIIAEVLRLDVSDPRLDGLVITEVKVTADIKEATVYYTLIGPDRDSEERLAEVEQGLKKATGLIRSKLSTQVETRQVPSLTFVLDDLPQSADKIDNLLLEASSRDKELSELAKNSKPIGEIDPYKSSDDQED